MNTNVCPHCGKEWQAKFRSAFKCPNCAIQGERSRVAVEMGIADEIANMRRTRQERRRRARK